MPPITWRQNNFSHGRWNFLIFLHPVQGHNTRRRCSEMPRPRAYLTKVPFTGPSWLMQKLAPWIEITLPPCTSGRCYRDVQLMLNLIIYARNNMGQFLPVKIVTVKVKSCGKICGALCQTFASYDQCLLSGRNQQSLLQICLTFIDCDNRTSTCGMVGWKGGGVGGVVRMGVIQNLQWQLLHLWTEKRGKKRRKRKKGRGRRRRQEGYSHPDRGPSTKIAK